MAWHVRSGISHLYGYKIDCDKSHKRPELDQCTTQSKLEMKIKVKMHKTSKNDTKLKRTSEGKPKIKRNETREE